MSSGCACRFPSIAPKPIKHTHTQQDSEEETEEVRGENIVSKKSDNKGWNHIDYDELEIKEQIAGTTFTARRKQTHATHTHTQQEEDLQSFIKVIGNVKKLH